MTKKVKCILVQALRLCTGRTAHRGSRGIALSFHVHGTRRGWGVSVTPRPLFTPRERPGTHCTGGWVRPRAGLDRCGISRPTGIHPRTARPAASRYIDYATRPIYYTFLGLFYIDLALRWSFRWNTFRFRVTNFCYNKVVALEWFFYFYIEVPEVNNTEKYVNLECRTFYFVKKLGERIAVGTVIIIRYI